jgi:hypothetical protein
VDSVSQAPVAEFQQQASLSKLFSAA